MNCDAGVTRGQSNNGALTFTLTTRKVFYKTLLTHCGSLYQHDDFLCDRFEQFLSTQRNSPLTAFRTTLFPQRGAARPLRVMFFDESVTSRLNTPGVNKTRALGIAIYIPHRPPPSSRPFLLSGTQFIPARLTEKKETSSNP